jgi:hypothetical protein
MGRGEGFSCIVTDQALPGNAMAKHSKKAFKNTVVVLDGHEFEHCVFENCTMQYDGSQTVALTGSTMNNCTWAFKGPAANAVPIGGAGCAFGGGHL